MAKKFEYMSTNEWLGDMTTHFMKSGEALRSPANRDQEALAKYIPKIANGVKVEYDISYDIPNKITGYKFTDFLTKAIYIAPQCSSFARKNITHACEMLQTKDGIKIVEQLKDSISDKYILHNTETFKCEDLIVLPGTNLLVKEDVLDMEKIDRLVNEGAYVKLHPITERTWVNYLKQRWGSKVIPADVPLYPILRNTKKVWFTFSSESGIAATLMGKKIGIVNLPEKKTSSNFEHIYRGIDACRQGSLIQRMTALFSHPESGILTTYHSNPEDRISAYFKHMSQYQHK